MASTYTQRNRIEKQGAGENANTWGTRLNTNVIDLIDAAMDGQTAIVMAGGNTTLSTANGAADEARTRYLKLSGTTGTITVPNVEKAYLVYNGGTGAATITTGSGTTAAVYPGNMQWVVCEGGNVCRLATVISVADTVPAYNQIPTGWGGEYATLFAGSSPHFTGTGSYAGISVPAGRGISLCCGIVGSASLIADATGILPYTTTTANAGNLYQAGSGTVVLRSTSSRRYKDHVEPADPALAARTLDIDVIWYRSKAKADDPAKSFWGVEAEQVAQIDPRLVHYAYQEDQFEVVETAPAELDKKGRVVRPAVAEVQVRKGQQLRPDGAQYERINLLRTEALKHRIEALEARLTAAGL